MNLKLGPQEERITFLVNSGAERTCVTTLPRGGRLSQKSTVVIEAEGEGSAPLP